MSNNSIKKKPDYLRYQSKYICLTFLNDDTVNADELLGSLPSKDIEQINVYKPITLNPDPSIKLDSDKYRTFAFIVFSKPYEIVYDKNNSAVLKPYVIKFYKTAKLEKEYGGKGKGKTAFFQYQQEIAKRILFDEKTHVADYQELGTDLFKVKQRDRSFFLDLTEATAEQIINQRDALFMGMATADQLINDFSFFLSNIKQQMQAAIRLAPIIYQKDLSYDVFFQEKKFISQTSEERVVNFEQEEKPSLVQKEKPNSVQTEESNPVQEKEPTFKKTEKQKEEPQEENKEAKEPTLVPIPVQAEEPKAEEPQEEEPSLVKKEELTFSQAELNNQKLINQADANNEMLKAQADANTEMLKTQALEYHSGLKIQVQNLSEEISELKKKLEYFYKEAQLKKERHDKLLKREKQPITPAVSITHFHMTLRLCDNGLSKKAAESRAYANARNRIAFMILFFSGIRVSELLEITFAQLQAIFFEAQPVYIPVQKKPTKKAELVFNVAPGVREKFFHGGFYLLDDYLLLLSRVHVYYYSQTDVSPESLPPYNKYYLFSEYKTPNKTCSRTHLTQSINTILRDAVAKCDGAKNVQAYSSHSFRVNVITRLIKKYGLTAARNHIRHDSIGTTALYDRNVFSLKQFEGLTEMMCAEETPQETQAFETNLDAKRLLEYASNFVAKGNKVPEQLVSQLENSFLKQTQEAIANDEKRESIRQAHLAQGTHDTEGQARSLRAIKHKIGASKEKKSKKVAAN